MNKEHTHKAKTHTNGKKVFDITRPDQVLAAPSSRPIITMRTPHIRDDQLVKNPDLIATVVPGSSQPADAMALMTHKHVGLKPLVEPLPAEHAEEAAEPAKEPEPEPARLVVTNSSAYGGSAFGPPTDGKPAPEAPQPQPEPKPEAEAKAEVEAAAPEAPKPSVEGLAVKNTVEVAADKPAPAVPAEAAAIPGGTQPATDAETQQPTAEELQAENMAMSGEFDVGKAIVSHHHQSSKGTVLFLFFLLIVLTLVLANVLLDMGLIQDTYNLPHTNFFN